MPMASRAKPPPPRYASLSPASTFKGVSRASTATWGNRFVRDHNDLIYDTDMNSLSRRAAAYRVRPQTKNQQVSSANPEESQVKPYQYSPQKSRKTVKSSMSMRQLSYTPQTENYLANVADYELKIRQVQQTAATTTRKHRFEPERAEVSEYYEGQSPGKSGSKWLQGIREHVNEQSQLQVSSRPKMHLNELGLSNFQYRNTIEGKVAHRANHHIDMRKSHTNKIDNRNKIWYDKDTDLPTGEQQAEQKHALSMKKTHPFGSYSSHRLFHRTSKMHEDNGSGWGGMLDKHYEHEGKINLNHERLDRQTPDYQLMTPRPQLPAKAGTNLDYPVQSTKTLALGDGRRAVMEISRTVRKVVFPRQVISPRRGCCR